MAPRSSSSRTVGVDVTAHKEESNLTDPRKKTKLRVRYYVELVVGSVRERHTRLGFSGSFKTLMALHETFLRAYLDKYGDQLQHAQQQQHPHGLTNSRASLSSSTSSSTSRSSLSSSSPRGGVKKFMNSFRIKKHIPTEPNAINHVSSSHHRSTTSNNQSEEIALPFLPPFPASNKLLVHLESGEAKDDSKISARSTALFDYYFQLFNSEEGELFLEIIQLRSIEQAEKNANNSSSNNNAADSRDASSSGSTRGGLFKFLSRHSKSSNNDITKRLEFSVPVQVSSSGKVRPLKHAKPRSESSVSRSR